MDATLGSVGLESPEGKLRQGKGCQEGNGSEGRQEHPDGREVYLKPATPFPVVSLTLQPHVLHVRVLPIETEHGASCQRLTWTFGL